MSEKFVQRKNYTYCVQVCGFRDNQTKATEGKDSVLISTYFRNYIYLTFLSDGKFAGLYHLKETVISGLCSACNCVRKYLSPRAVSVDN